MIEGEVMVIHLWALEGFSALVYYLIKVLGMPVDLRAPTSQRTALHFACAFTEREIIPHLMMVKRLLYLGADKSLTDGKGETTADIALRLGHQEIYDILTLEERTKAAAEAEAALLADLEKEETEGAKKGKEGTKSGGGGGGKKKNKSKNRTRPDGGSQQKKAGGGGDEEKEQGKKTTRYGAAAAGGGGGRGAGTLESAAQPKEQVVAEEAITAAMGDLEFSPPQVKDVKEEEEEEQEEEDPNAFDDFLLADAPDTLVCPIFLGLLTEPVLCMDTHTYQRASIEEWMESRRKKGQPIISPKTQAPMAEVIIFNQVIKTQVVEYIEAKTKAWKELQAQKKDTKAAGGGGGGMG
jgi:hypothetical protein